MSTTIDQAFITQFESDVHLAFQRMGSKLLNTVRKKDGVNGSTVRFPKLGKGTATTKERHAEVVAMDLAHTYVEATLADYYAPEWIDKLDELKTNVDERMAYAESSAAACGRKADQIITTEMDNATNTEAVAGAGLTLAKVNTAFIQFGENDVPEDGNRYMAVSPESWTDLLAINEFSNADYVGADNLPYKGGMVAKRWLGFLVFPFSGLPIDGSSVRSNICWHKRAIGCGVGQEITTEINYVPTRVSNLVNAFLSLGAKIIDNDGLRVLYSQE